jgi:hypothetical protein
MPVEMPRPAGTGVRCRLLAADGTVTECDRWEFALPHGRRALFYRFAHRPAFDGTQPVPVLGIERNALLATPEHLMEVLRRDWVVAQRDERPVTIMRFDVDAYRGYQDVFGRMATENVMRQVGRTISSARDAEHVVARFETSSSCSAVDGPGCCAPSQSSEDHQLAIHHPSCDGRYSRRAPACGCAARSQCESLLDRR